MKQILLCMVVSMFFCAFAKAQKVQVETKYHRIPYHKKGKVALDVIHLQPGKWSDPFTSLNRDIFYSYLTDDTVVVKVAAYYPDKIKPVYVDNLSQENLLDTGNNNVAYSWFSKTEVDVVIVQADFGPLKHLLRKAFKHFSKKDKEKTKAKK